MKKITALLLALLMILSSVTVLSSCGDTEKDTSEETASETDTEKETESEFEEVKVELSDQTGHPEVSAANVDVEALLKVNKNFDYSDEYKVKFVSQAERDYPHLYVSDKIEENGIVLKDIEEWGSRLKDRYGKNGIRLTSGKNEDLGKIYISLDDATAEKLSGKNVELKFNVSSDSNSVKIALKYVDKDGNDVELSAKSTSSASGWTNISFVIESALFGKGIDGYDFELSFKNAKSFFINEISVKEAEIKKEEEVKLYKSRYNKETTYATSINVKDYGALGDGKADDTAAFIAAIGAAADKNGGIVFVPAGYYCITSSLVLPHSVGLVGELEEGTAKGTVLCIYTGKGTTDEGQSAVKMNMMSALENIAFWYPEQTFVNGEPIPYPSTVSAVETGVANLKNVTFVNSYYAVNFDVPPSNSLQVVQGICGTPLKLGYINDNSYDIGRIENVSFSPEYWTGSGLPGAPNAELLKTWLKRNATGLVIERIDWEYLCDIEVENYNIGLHTRASDTGSGMSNGHVYNLKLIDCYYCIYAEEQNWMLVTNATLKASGGDDAAAIYINKKCVGHFSLSYCDISSEGKTAISNNSRSTATIALSSCKVSSKGEEPLFFANSKAKKAIINTEFANGTFTSAMEDVPALPNVDYNRKFVTKPASDKLVNLGEEPYSIKNKDDITAKLQEAINSLKETGGTVYVPEGTYTISDHIDVWAGIEVRGPVSTWISCGETLVFSLEFGKGGDVPVFTLYDGSGMRGIRMSYPDHFTPKTINKYSYVIRGNGKGIYLCNLTMINMWDCIDFATYRCDEHYVCNIWGAAINTFIKVGSGSKDGIIRDCHFTPNTWYTAGSEGWQHAWDQIMKLFAFVDIGESTNEIVYHNFTYGAHYGIRIGGGAKGTYVLGHGVDSGSLGAFLEGDCEATLIDSQLVNLGSNERNYIRTADDYTGKARFVNYAGWGAPNRAMQISGNGTLDIYGGMVIAPGSPMCMLNGGQLSVRGLIDFGTVQNFKIAKSGVKGLHLSGNVFWSKLAIDGHKNTEVTGTDFAKK